MEDKLEYNIRIRLSYLESIQRIIKFEKWTTPFWYKQINDIIKEYANHEELVNKAKETLVMYKEFNKWWESEKMKNVNEDKVVVKSNN
jgi:hypothetical protein